MSMGLLGMMASGAAVANRDMRNAEVDQENKIKSALFTLQMKDAFDQRVEERRAKQEHRTYQRDRSDLLEDEQRKFAREDTVDERRRTHDMDKLKFQRSAALEQEGMRQKGADRRSAMKVLKSGATDKTGTALEKSIETKRKRLFELKKELHDPQKSWAFNQNSDYKRVMEDEIRQLETQIVVDEARLQKSSSGGDLLDLNKYPKGQ